MNTAVFLDHQINEYIEQIAHLRIDVFKEYPYLYEGDLDYETKYLRKFSNTPDSLVVALKDERHNIVGAITGLPLMYEDATVKAPWIERGDHIEGVYYFSEILIYPEYRNKGFGKRIFDQAEAAVCSLGRYNRFSLATVIRGENHAAMPKVYKALDGFWIQKGYRKQSELVCHIQWKEIGEKHESLKPLVFWVKTVEEKCV